MVEQMMTNEEMMDCPHLEAVQHGLKWHLVCDERTDKERERDSAQYVLPDSETCRSMRKTLTKFGFVLFCDDEME